MVNNKGVRSADRRFSFQDAFAKPELKCHTIGFSAERGRPGSMSGKHLQYKFGVIL
jgi:hypothetical protein